MINLYSYRLPFKKPFQTGADRYTHRQGVLIQFSDTSFEILSEAAPLPGFSADSLKEVITLLKNLVSELNTFLKSNLSPVELNHFIRNKIPLPSAAFAVSYLGLNLLSKRNRVDLGELLNSGIRHRIQVNDVIPIQPVKETETQIRKSYKNGFRTFKLKADKTVDSTIHLLQNLHLEDFSDITFRIDANRSWTPDQFLSSIEELSRFPVEYIEEPLSIENLSKLKSMANASSIPIALDESILNLEDLAAKLDFFEDDFFIIKPMRFGNLFDLFETISSRRTHLNRVVVTTMLESAVGRAMCASLAGLIGDPSLAHGLNTGQYFEHDLIVTGKGSPILNLPDSGFFDFSISRLNTDFIQKLN